MPLTGLRRGEGGMLAQTAWRKPSRTMTAAQPLPAMSEAVAAAEEKRGAATSPRAWRRLLHSLIDQLLQVRVAVVRVRGAGAGGGCGGAEDRQPRLWTRALH
jgi:hypothetical protein